MHSKMLAIIIKDFTTNEIVVDVYQSLQYLCRTYLSHLTHIINPATFRRSSSHKTVAADAVSLNIELC